MSKPKKLTTPDLVVLALLTEKPMHGYEIVQILEGREIQDWAEVSRPQVYYSVKKLKDGGYTKESKDLGSTLGPERQVFVITKKGEQALAESLKRPDWSLKRNVPPFLTWLALSGNADKKTIREQIKRRKDFLKNEIEKEYKILKGIPKEELAMVKEARLMLKLHIDSFKLELKWLENVTDTIL